ncbi:MAG: hypothetical protein IJE74_00410 [Clostridia bacterium]|nr:hypothetical protein [Clostridia bacterium]
MKKIISILVALSAVLSLVSCSVDSGKTTAEKLSEAEVERSRLVEESIQAEVERSEKINEKVDKLGKTEKGKRLVIEIPYAHGEEYRVFEMDRNEECKQVITYFFYSDMETFEVNREKDDDDRFDVDKKLKMVAFKRDYESEYNRTFDELYEVYTSDYAKEQKYVVIE